MQADYLFVSAIDLPRVQLFVGIVIQWEVYLHGSQLPMLPKLPVLNADGILWAMACPRFAACLGLFIPSNVSLFKGNTP